MAEGKLYGTVDGVPITDEVIDRIVKNAEEGFPGVTAKKVGRPSLGAGPATTVAVRLDPSLHAALLERAESEHASTSDVMRSALRNYLEAS